MFESTKLNAERQVQISSMQIHAADTQPALIGPVRAVHAFVKMPGLEVASAQGLPQHALCKAAMGVSFAAGTTDGPGMFNFEQGQGNSSNPLWRFIGGARRRGRAAVGTAVTVPVECFYARP